MEPLATVADLAAWVRQEIPADDPQALAFLAAASARVRAYTGKDFADVVIPDEVVTVTTQVAARVWLNPRGYIQDTTGPFTVRMTERAADLVYLTEDEQDTLNAYRASTRTGLWTLGTTRGDIETGRIAVHDWYELG